LAQPTNRGDGLVRQSTTAGVDDERAFRADLKNDVTGVADEHVQIVADRPHMNLAVTRLRVHCRTNRAG
jgi:hypothetical protein